MPNSMFRALSATAFVVLFVAGCAKAGAEADAGFVGSPDARQPADARQNPDGASPDAPPSSDAQVADAQTGTSDAAVTDAAVGTPDAQPPADSGVLAYSHTITIDGVNDFDLAKEEFATTSAGYNAYISWDATHVYLGFGGADVASTDANKWLMVFFDTDPGSASGALVGELYNTQRPGLPSGFGAEYYYRWRASNDFQDLQAYSAGAWSPVTTTLDAFQSGTFMEVAIARTALGDPAKLGITLLMVNETNLSEGAYAGLYTGNFTDGYYDAAAANIPLTAYFEADFASAASPNDLANRRP